MSNTCPDCGGTGKITLMRSVVPCERCIVGRAIEFDPATRTAIVEFNDNALGRVVECDPATRTALVEPIYPDNGKPRIGPEVWAEAMKFVRMREKARGEQIAAELTPDCADDRLTIGDGLTGEWARECFATSSSARSTKP